MSQSAPRLRRFSFVLIDFKQSNSRPDSQLLVADTSYFYILMAILGQEGFSHSPAEFLAVAAVVEA